MLPGPRKLQWLVWGTRLVSSGAMVQTKAGWLLPLTSWTVDSDKQRGLIPWDCLCAVLVLINEAPDYVLTPPTCHPPLFFVRVQSVKGIKGKQSDSILIPSKVETLLDWDTVYWCGVSTSCAEMSYFKQFSSFTKDCFFNFFCLFIFLISCLWLPLSLISPKTQGNERDVYPLTESACD